MTSESTCSSNLRARLSEIVAFILQSEGGVGVAYDRPDRLL